MPRSWLLLILATGAGFAVGSVNPAAITARVLQADVRHSGSGNPGATNVGRVLGLRYGVLVGLLDVVKGFLPTVMALVFLDRLTAYVVALACVLGHVVSPFLRGRGGKGVATSFGATLALLPWFGLAALAAFLLVVWRTRWVAKASLSGLAVLAVLSAVAPVPPPVVVARVWGVLVAALVALRHHSNIRGWVAHRLG